MQRKVCRIYKCILPGGEIKNNEKSIFPSRRGLLTERTSFSHNDNEIARSIRKDKSSNNDLTSHNSIRSGGKDTRDLDLRPDFASVLQKRFNLKGRCSSDADSRR